MEAKELMIGDWVSYDGECVKIEGVTTDSGRYKYPFSVEYIDGRDFAHIAVLNVDPIPLTEEILLKNGFYVYSKNDYSEAKLDVKIDSLEYQICGTRKADKWHISIYKIKWEDRTKGKYNSCCLFSSGLFGEYDQIYVHEIQHSLRQCGLSDMADNFKIE